MYRGKSTIGVITARGGSKGIPRKNIKDLCGKPLIAWTIDAARASRYLTRCVVSTDDAEIANVARAHDGDVPFLRPAELAQDHSGSIEVVQHALTWLEQHDGQMFDYAMILQSTSPLRTAADIDACIEQIVDTSADSVMSVLELSDFALKKLKVITDGTLQPFAEAEGKTSASRQDLARVYKRNCAIYLTRTDLLMASDLFGEVSRPYVMPRERSVDINEPVDFELAEFWMQRAMRTHVVQDPHHHPAVHA